MMNVRIPVVSGSGQKYRGSLIIHDPELKEAVWQLTPTQEQIADLTETRIQALTLGIGTLQLPNGHTFRVVNSEDCDIELLRRIPSFQEAK